MNFCLLFLFNHFVDICGLSSIFSETENLLVTDSNLRLVFMNLFYFRYKALGLTEAGHKWKLFFKIFCFLQPELVEVESVEYGFLYEQASLPTFSKLIDIYSTHLQLLSSL